MINLRGPGNKSEYYNEYTVIDSPVYPHYVGNDSIPLAWSKGAIGVVPKDGSPNSYTTMQTIHFALKSGDINSLVNDYQFHGLLNKARDEPKFKSDGLEDVECSVQFRGRRNCLVHEKCVGDEFKLGESVYYFPSLIPDQTSATPAYAFLAVNEKVLGTLLATLTTPIAVTDELLGRLFIGRADIGKDALKKNVPVYACPYSH
jgi:hypothetical protein